MRASVVDSLWVQCASIVSFGINFVDTRDNAVEMVGGVKFVCEGLDHYVLTIAPIIFPDVNKLIARLGCLTSFVGMVVFWLWCFRSVTMPEDTVVLDSDMVVRENNIKLFSITDFSIVSKYRGGITTELFNHCDYFCLRTRDAVRVTDTAPGVLIDAVCYRGTPLMLRVGRTLPQNLLVASCFESNCLMFVDKLVSEMWVRSGKVVDSRSSLSPRAIGAVTSLPDTASRFCFPAMIRINRTNPRYFFVRACFQRETERGISQLAGKLWMGDSEAVSTFHSDPT